MSLPPLMGRAEIATALGVTPRKASAIVNRPDFPRPWARITRGSRRIWLAADVEAWKRDRFNDRAPAVVDQTP